MISSAHQVGTGYSLVKVLKVLVQRCSLRLKKLALRMLCGNQVM